MIDDSTHDAQDTGARHMGASRSMFESHDVPFRGKYKNGCARHVSRTIFEDVQHRNEKYNNGDISTQ